MNDFAPYAKFIVAILGSGTTAALGLIGPGTDLFVVLTVLSAMLTAAGVYVIPNGTGKRRAE
ncbi:hypothetical protein ASF21_12935 [Arthrobacter sp. Leaf234]|uniref:hypothetical protein n=1 Tax=Arthrobacter sp. Leaf234 TaxID=1736303 RepID=UPI0006F8BBFD|nr:hypothetical protein [Arthrobacter sp. Leaf234]KQN99707.1 hypothetical protein ASF21_12935 [Arthrobacter sp. Leaf234]